MWHGDWNGADWVIMAFSMMLFWTAVVALTVWLVRGSGGSGAAAPREGAPPEKPAGEHRPTAREILDERYARGELSDEEYRARRDTLARQ